MTTVHIDLSRRDWRDRTDAYTDAWLDERLPAGALPDVDLKPGEEAALFVDLLHGGSKPVDGFAEYVMIHPSPAPGQKKVWSIWGYPNSLGMTHLICHQLIDAPASWGNNGYDINVGIATRADLKEDGQRGREGDALMVPALWADIDDPDITALQEFPLVPNVLIHSGKGAHAYWLLDEPAKASPMVKRILKALATRVDGDVAAANLQRVMRLPGSINHKYGNRARIAHLSLTNIYNLADFIPLDPGVRTERIEVDLPQRTADQIPQWIKDVLSGPIPEGERVNTLFRVAGNMQTYGFSEQDTLNTVIGPFTGAGLREGEVRYQVKAVYRTPARGQGAQRRTQVRLAGRQRNG